MGKTKFWGATTFLLLLVLAGTQYASQGEEPQTSKSPGNVEGRNNDPGKKELPYQDYALFIGGISNPRGALATYEESPGWVRYAEAMNRNWERFDHRQLRPMRDWAAKELAATPDLPRTVFYPFGGPDVINMRTFFPKAQTYLMVALEPVGELPVFEARDERNFFAGLQRSLYELLHLNFFITNKLRSVTQSKELKGALPVLLFFLAREKAQVLEVQYWLMQPDGAIKVKSALKREKPAGEGIPGVRIVFTSPGSTEKQTLYYFCFNLRNDSWQRHQHFVTFLKGFGPLATFEKAASYLMFRPYFSAIREFILDRSLYVLQTDSGIPLKHFDQAAWSLKFYGNYDCPIRLFSNCRQPDMAAIYRQREDIPPLPFGIGYHHRIKTSNLMFASRKDKAPGATKPQAKDAEM